VQLKQGAILVPGTVTFADPTQLRVTFTPDTHLAGNTDYQLVVTQAITDVNGLPLDSAITAPFTTLPPPPPNLVFASVSAGYYHICGVTTAGAAYCWGSNSNGVLGDGTTVDNFTPVPVAGGHRDGERGCLPPAE
jgi:alpha-tubulin suppressor-like RCC1 family protein